MKLKKEMNVAHAEASQIVPLFKEPLGKEDVCEEFRKHLQDMLDIGAIQRFTSLWASPIVLVRKKDGSL